VAAADRRLRPGGLSEPVINVDWSRGSDFDAIFLGGGSAGRFGAAVLRSLGGRALVLERWPFLGGSCPHQACVPHHLFSEAARELDQAQAPAGQLWYGKFDPEAASVLGLVELFRSQRVGPHAHMNWQSSEQLGIEFIVNAEAAVVDAHTVTAVGRTFTARALVLCTGSRPARPGTPGEYLPGVFDYASFIEDLDYEPTRIVVIGGSKVAVEYASFYRATGTPATVVSRGPLLATGGPGRMDEDLRRFIIDVMRDRDVELLEYSTVTRITGRDQAAAVAVATPRGTRRLEADFVLLATGEQPNVESFDARTRRVVGIHHAGYGAKAAFQYLHHLMRRPGGTDRYVAGRPRLARSRSSAKTINRKERSWVASTAR
jgi:2-oxopropyl-CoM reductase (carboxylating)